MTLRYALTTFVLSIALSACADGDIDASRGSSSASEVADAAPEVEAPVQAPEFTLEGPDGAFALADQRGHVVLLTFWATWSEPSIAALDTVAAVAAELAAGDLVAVGVSQDEHGLEALRAWADSSVAGARVAVTLVSDSSHAVARSYGDVEMLPTTVVIDRDGHLRTRHVGVLSTEGLLDLVAPALIESDEPLEGGEAIAAPAGIRSLEPGSVPALVAEGAALLDVRDAGDLLGGTLQYARHRPLPALAREDLPANVAAPIIFLGATLAEAVAAAERAAEWGYDVVYAVGGGPGAWRDAGLELVPVQPARRRTGVVG